LVLLGYNLDWDCIFATSRGLYLMAANKSNDTPKSSDISLSSVISDYSHPLYLRLSDHQRMTTLVPTRFNGSGFPSWRRAMLIASSTKNKIGFIDGSFPNPSSNLGLLRQWEYYNDMVISWILNTADNVLYTINAACI